MKNNKLTTEELLENGKGLSFSASEHATMKSELLSYAKYHGIKSANVRETTWSTSIWTRAIATSSLALILFVGTGYTSTDSLPGELLYKMKVNLVEEMISYTKNEPDEFIAYKISLMENRLEELQALADQSETPDPEDLAELTNQIREHVSEITDTLDTSFISHKNKIAVLSKLSGLSQAQAKVSQNEEDLSVIINQTKTTQEITSDALNEAIQDFVDDQPTESVNDYISEHLTHLGEQITASTTNEDARDSATQHLNDVNEALTEGNTTAAIISTLEAEQNIAVDNYLSETNSYQETLENNN